jgi:hypothetical protein
MSYKVVGKITKCILHTQCILLESNKYRMAQFNEHKDNGC